MYIAMNRFKIAPGREEDFIAIWKNRETYLDGVPGFQSFHLLQGPGTEQYTLFVSHPVWASEQDFSNWTKSEQFRKAHAHAGGQTKNIYLGPPQFEGFKAVV